VSRIIVAEATAGPASTGLSPTRETSDHHHDPSAVPAQATPVFTNTEALTLAGFLVGYRGLTRQADELDLRQYASWCRHQHLRLFQAPRGRRSVSRATCRPAACARATITRRLCTIAGFYPYAVEEDLLYYFPAAHVRRPRLDYESHAIELDRNKLGALIVAAGLGSDEHALISLLALNGLGVSEATGANSEALGIERAHRTLVIPRKGGNVVTIPLAPRTARAIDLAVGERVDRADPRHVRRAAARPARCRAARPPRRQARRITRPAGPHRLRHAFITAALDAGLPLRDVQEAASHADPRTTMPYDRARGSLDRHATYIVAAYIAGAAR